MVKTLFHLVALLPNTWAQRLGAMVGALLFRLNTREKRTAATNIALCFPHLSTAEQQQLLKQTLCENAKTLLELPRIFQQGGQYAANLISEVNGINHYHTAIARSKGVILLAPHLGNWELVIHYLNPLANITAMFDPPKQKFLNEIMRQGRQSSGGTLVPADGTGVRTQLKHLQQGGVIGILPDQVPQHNNAGIHASFMGQVAFTMTLVNNLAKRSDADVLMTFAERLPVGKGYRLHIFPAPSGINDNDPIIAATALNQGVADCVNLAPAQYQWTYKRFKHQPNGAQEPYH